MKSAPVFALISQILCFVLYLILTFILACNCNEFGSVNENCTEYGVCYCRPGVLGVKCDQCPENKFNLSVGCICKYLKDTFNLSYGNNDF